MDWCAEVTHPSISSPRDLIALLALCLISSGCIHTAAVKPRPENWAQTVEVAGMPNLHRVSPELYRSALPGERGYESARKFGIKTVVNLRPGPSTSDLNGKPDPDYLNIPVRTSEPTYDQARLFLKVVDDPARAPVLLHCYHGADRTGAFIALYRINRQGWTKDEAIREMTGGGYHFHTMWKSLVDWVRDSPPL